MVLSEALRVFSISMAKANSELKKNSGILGIHLTPTVRPVLQKLYVDLHNLLQADGSVPDVKRLKD